MVLFDNKGSTARLLQALAYSAALSLLSLGCAGDTTTEDPLSQDGGYDADYDNQAGEQQGQAAAENGQSYDNSYGEAYSQEAPVDQYGGENFNNATEQAGYGGDQALDQYAQQPPANSYEGQSLNNSVTDEFAYSEQIPPQQQPAIDQGYSDPAALPGDVDTTAVPIPVAAPPMSGGRVMYARYAITLHTTPDGPVAGTLERGDHPLIWTQDSVPTAVPDVAGYDTAPGVEAYDTAAVPAEIGGDSYEVVEQQPLDPTLTDGGAVQNIATESIGTPVDDSVISNGLNADAALQGEEGVNNAIDAAEQAGNLGF